MIAAALVLLTTVATVGSDGAQVGVDAEHAIDERWSIAFGLDAVHDRGSTYAEIRYAKGDWSFYGGLDGGKNPRGGVTFTLLERGGFSFATGLTIAKPDEEVGTPWRYNLSVEYALSPKWSIGLLHESNCKTLCRSLHLPLPRGPEGTVNHGQNWVVLRRDFRW